ncbi:(2Fe-2S)-binding protein [Actinophytocola sp. NPDC049390]|uniref:(2Fe-2S)-binding protein n=1 Tax=Actinophytocola sp. NPDC049390 TaxID=3363894 RepID=UPI003789756D
MPAVAVTDPAWLADALAATASRFALTDSATTGVLWWYSASSVLLGPVAGTYVAGGRVADPALASMTLFPHPDGRLLDARSSSTVDRAEAPARTAAVVATCVDAVAAASGASTRALWAIATDSLANRVLWAGGTAAHAVELAADDRFPVPRYVTVDGQPAVRRASCCLVYESPGQRKCVSCPRQRPDDRVRRMRAALRGQGT